MQSVFIDNCAWDVFFKYKLDLLKELPIDSYDIVITREENFEIDAIPEDQIGKKHLKEYIRDQISKRKIRTDKIFGFFNPYFSIDMPIFPIESASSKPQAKHA